MQMLIWQQFEYWLEVQRKSKVLFKGCEDIKHKNNNPYTVQ
jgi:hypothetical protein